MLETKPGGGEMETEWKEEALALSLSFPPFLPLFLTLTIFWAQYRIFLSFPVSFTGPLSPSVLQMRLGEALQLQSVEIGLGLHVCQIPKVPILCPLGQLRLLEVIVGNQHQMNSLF